MHTDHRPLAAVAGIAGMAAVAGAALNWPELIGISAGLLVLAVLVLTITRPPRAASWWDIDVPARVTRDEAATARIGVHIDGSARWVSAIDTHGHRARLQGGASELIWPVPTSRRGRWPVGPRALEFADPFGLTTAVLAERTPTDVLVVPRVSPAPVLDPFTRDDDGALGERSGVEQFHSLREHVTGDPVKLVHWRASARAGTLLVRRMVDTTLPSLLIVLDVSQASYRVPGAMFGDYDAAGFERAVDLAASWAWANCTTAQRVLLATTAPSSPSIEITAHARTSALDWLALVESVPASQALPGRVSALARRSAARRIVLVTGTEAPAADAWARSWSRDADVRVVRTS